MNIIKDELIKHIYEYDVVLVGMGINNSFNNGFAYDIKINFPEVKDIENERSMYGDVRKYGTILPIECDGIIFCMCYVHNGGYAKHYDNVFVKYDLVDRCLEEVSKRYGNKKIATMIMGSTLYDGNGDRNTILELFSKYFADKNIDIYDYEQKSFRLEIHHELSALYKEFRDKKITFDEMLKRKSYIYWKKNNGIFKEMPSDYVYKKRDKNGKRLTVKKSDFKK